MGAGRPPGATGTTTGTSTIHPGTLSRGGSPLPGAVGDRTRFAFFEHVGASLGRVGRYANRSYALAEAQAGIIFMSAYIQYVNAAGETKDELGRSSRVYMSLLGPELLEAYLRGRVSLELLDKIKREILNARTWRNLALALEAAVNDEARRLRRPPSGAEILAIARKTASLKDYKDPDTGERIYFRNNLDDRGLQIVVGGVTKLEIRSCNVMAGQYELQIILGDVYDFENKRETMPTYDRFRKRLAHLLTSGHYGTFWWEYHQALYGGNPVDRGRVFASFMYAIEKAGFTSPISWEVTLVGTGPVPGA